MPSVASCTWAGSPSEGRLAEALADFLDGLSDLNHELNGPVPSEAVGADPDLPLSTSVAYSVAVVADMLRNYGEKQRDPAALRGAWLVETAWLAVLAGDIDDIAEHLADEERMRG